MTSVADNRCRWETYRLFLKILQFSGHDPACGLCHGPKVAGSTEDFLVICDTDGSKIDGRVGFAFVVFRSSVESENFQFRIRDESSAFVAELVTSYASFLQQVLWILWARINDNSFPTKSKKRDVKKICK
ncbi:hypothetical protein TNCV_48261 [Trichonephila clavipes]|nr:hypothetical protein TNCV_48261 [Trichonephila clavipes]